MIIKRHRRACMGAALAFALTVPLHAGQTAEPSEAERATQSRTLIKGFAKQLKARLVTAMKDGGPTAAIAVCNAVAPEIAQQSSDDSGWTVGRTALKLRNPKNAPDDWERAVLDDFSAKALQGQDLTSLEHFETVTREGKRVFRYMKAIPVGKPCLACHGSNVRPDVLETIRQFYPDDQATGFKAGGLRGAFTISQPID